MPRPLYDTLVDDVELELSSHSVNVHLTVVQCCQVRAFPPE